MPLALSGGSRHVACVSCPVGRGPWPDPSSLAATVLAMLTWLRQKTLAGCRLRRTHLEELHDGAIAGHSEPVVVSWEGVGWARDAVQQGEESFRVRTSSLADLETEVGHKTLTALKLTVSLASAPNESRVEVTMGDFKRPGGGIEVWFAALLLAHDSRWYTRLRVCDPDAEAARDRMDALEKVLMRSQGIRRLAGGSPLMVHCAIQTTLLWFFITEVGLNQGPIGGMYMGITLAAAALFGWQLFAGWLTRTRVHVMPAAVPWWQQLTTNQGLSGAIGAIVGILGLLVAVVSVIVTVLVA